MILYGCFWLPSELPGTLVEETLFFLSKAKKWWLSTVLTLSSCEQCNGISYGAHFLSHHGIKALISFLSPQWKVGKRSFRALHCAGIDGTGDWAEFTFKYLLIYAPLSKRFRCPHLSPSSPPSSPRPALSPSAAPGPTLLVPWRVPLGSAPFQKEFSSPRRCSEDDLETKVKCKSFAHPCDWNRGEGSFPIVVFSRSLVSVNPVQLQFRLSCFTFFCACCICFYLYIPSRSYIVYCPSLGCCRAGSAPAWELYFSVGLCLNKRSQKDFVPSHTLQFCVSGSILVSTFSQICEFVKLDFLMLPDYWGEKINHQNHCWNHIRY